MDPAQRQAFVLDWLLVFRGGLGPHLRGAFDALDARLALTADRAPGYFLHPLALPVLDLPAWTAAACARAGRPLSDESVHDAVLAAAAGYLHVRVQDDLLDEGEGAAAPAMLLAEALLLGHQDRLRRVVGASAPFWAAADRLWLAYGEAMLLEHAHFAGDGVPDAAAFERVLDRSRPLVLPPLAVLDAAGRAERAADLHALVDHLVRAHQLYTDLLDVEKDLRHGNRTWLVRRFAPSGEPAALRRRLYLEGGFDEVVAEVAAGHQAAAEHARALDLPEVERFLARRAAHMEDARAVAFRALFDTLLR
jgi:hypothetical protein